MTEIPNPYDENTPPEADDDIEDLADTDVVEAPGPNPYTENTTVENDNVHA